VNAPVVLGAYGAAALLLAAGGGAKALRPHATARALGQLDLLPRQAGRLVFSPAAVRIAGLVEVAVGGAALFAAGRAGTAAAGAVAASYALFAVVVAMAYRRRAPLSSCGCFGETEAPPTPAHAALNLGFAACAVAVLVGSHASVARVTTDRPATGVVFALLTVTTAYLAYLVMTLLPQLARASGEQR
jgi:hypothetical protein